VKKQYERAVKPPYDTREDDKKKGKEDKGHERKKKSR
jgi:hypothetical protein